MTEALDNEDFNDDKEVNNKDLINKDNDKDTNNNDLIKDVNDNTLTHTDESTEIGDDDEVFNDTVKEDELTLSTIDNPYNPKTHYDMWKRWDNDNGYNTEEYIARLISMEEGYDVDDDFMLNVLSTKVINEILENDSTNLYRLI